MQALQHKTSPQNIDGLVEAVETAYANMDRTTLNYVFLSLQTSMESTMLAKGSNKYKLCPMSKDRLRGQGELSIGVMCDPEAIVTRNSILLEGK